MGEYEKKGSKDIWIYFRGIVDSVICRTVMGIVYFSRCQIPDLQ